MISYHWNIKFDDYHQIPEQSEKCVFNSKSVNSIFKEF